MAVTIHQRHDRCAFRRDRLSFNSDVFFSFLKYCSTLTHCHSAGKTAQTASGISLHFGFTFVDFSLIIKEREIDALILFPVAFYQLI
jgi:hypothetical protein